MLVVALAAAVELIETIDPFPVDGLSLHGALGGLGQIALIAGRACQLVHKPHAVGGPGEIVLKRCLVGLAGRRPGRSRRAIVERPDRGGGRA